MIRAITNKPLNCVRKKGPGVQGGKEESYENSETVQLLSDELGKITEKLEFFMKNIEDKDAYISKLEQNIVDLIEFDRVSAGDKKQEKGGSMRKRKKNADQ